VRSDGHHFENGCISAMNLQISMEYRMQMCIVIQVMVSCKKIKYCKFQMAAGYYIENQLFLLCIGTVCSG